MLHLLTGNLKEGWRDYAARMRDRRQGAGHGPEQLGRPGRGDPLKRTRLLVRAEQGVGDQIMFVSLIPDLSGARRGGRRLRHPGMRAAACVAWSARSFPAATVKPAIARRP